MRYAVTDRLGELLPAYGKKIETMGNLQDRYSTPKKKSRGAGYRRIFLHMVRRLSETCAHVPVALTSAPRSMY